MTLLSGFELLAQSIVPSQLTPGASYPAVIQAYFLLISHVNPSPGESSQITVELAFQPNQGDLADFRENVLGFFDINAYQTVILNQQSPTAPVTTTFNLPSGGTGLFLLQPSFKFLLEQNPNFEVRGFVDIKASGQPNVQLLVSPQVRGTFFRTEQSSSGDSEISISRQLPGNSVSKFVTSVDKVPKLSLLPEDIYAEQAYSLPTVSGPLYTFS